MKDSLEELRKKAWRTASARYNSARRIRRKDIFSTLSLSLFSASIIAVAFIQKIFVISGSSLDNYLTAISACLGLLILVLTLVEWAGGSGVKADALYRNAEELNDFQTRISIIVECEKKAPSLTVEQYEKLALEYAKIRTSCSYNHEPVDDTYFISKHRFSDEFRKSDNVPAMTCFESFCATLAWKFASTYFYILTWVVFVF